MKLFWIITIITLSVVVNAADDHFQVLGIEFPSMKKSEWLEDNAKILHTQYSMTFDLSFYLNDSGLVDSVVSKSDHKAVYIDSLKASLNAIEFYAARFEGRKIPFILPGQLIIERRYNRVSARLELPYDEINCMMSKTLIEKAMHLNGFILPAIERFPEYYINFKENTKIYNYPYLVLKISIDSVGTMTDYETVASFGGQSARYVEVPLLYATYRPASFQGNKLNSEFYVIFRMFDFIQYPTSPWVIDPDSISIYPFNYLRLEHFWYRDSLVNLPLPYNNPGEIYSIGEIVPFTIDVKAVVSIDTTGAIVRYEIDRMIPDPLTGVIKQVMSELKFAPARDWDNQRQPFEGTLRLFFNNSRDIRISADWLPQNRPPVKQ